MATGTLHEQTAAQPRSADAERYQDYIEHQLDKTSTYVRTVDIAAALTTLVIGVFGVMLVAAVLDHWLIPGGLGGLGRWVFFLTITGGAGYFTARFVLPLLLRRINPLYAARALEQSEPTLKNSLINFLLLRTSPSTVRAGVFRAVESRAARDLTHVSVDTAVDRSHLIKLGYVLVGLLVAFAAYVFISPKNPLPSIGRVIVPWSDIDRPSRVEIELYPHEPKEVFRGQHLSVSALVHGLAGDEPVTLYWSTADGQITDEPVVMYREKDDPRHRCKFPENDESGLRQDISYWVVAGDTRTPKVDVPVLEELFINVDEVRYAYPSYTGKQPTSQSHGDIRAVEGTTVTIVATANQPIETAHLDYDCDGTMDELASRIDGHRAEFEIPLALRGKDRQIEESTYWVRFFTKQGLENAKPVKHRIEVLPDWPPEVNIVAPQDKRWEMTPNAKMPFRLRARDNDYGLVHVGFVVEQGPQKLASVPLLAEKDRPWVGEAWLERSWVFEPAKYKLQPGDVVHISAEVKDNKQPRAQQRSSRQKIEVVIIEPRKGDPRDPNAQPGAKKPGDPMGGEPQGKPDMGEPNEQPGQGDQPKKDQPNKDDMGKNDGMNDAGDGGQDGMGGEQDMGGAKDQPKGGGEKGMGENGGANGGEQGAGGEPKPKGGEKTGAGKPGAGGEKTDDPNAKPGEGEPTEGDGTGGGAPKERPVNSNDDREVLDRLNEHRKQQGGASGEAQPGDKKTDGGTSEKPAGGNPGDMGTKPGDMNRDGGTKPEHGTAQGDGQKNDPKDPGSKTGPNDPKPPGDKKGEPKVPGDKPKGGAKDPMKGSGETKPMGDEMAPGSGETKPSDNPKESPMGGDNSGAGDMKPGEKKPMGGDMDDKATAPGKPEDAKQGDGMGKADHNGKVDGKPKAKGGNKAGDEDHGSSTGKGKAGSSTPEDDGAGMSKEEGKGETSGEAGDDKEAEGMTGESDPSKKGDGTRKDGTGDKKGGAASNQPQNGKSPMNSEETGGEPDKTPGDGSSGKTDKTAKDGTPNGFGGDREGRVRKDTDDDPPAGEDSPVPDRKRREYARQTTELALDHLKKELAKSDSDLFKKGNMSREQTKAWAKKMEDQLKAAKKAGPKSAAQQKLDQTLDNLGIHPQRSTVGRGSARDQFRDVRRGTRTRPPADFADQFRAYKKGTSQSGR